MKRKSLLLIIVLAILAWAGTGRLHDSRINRRFASIQSGATEQSVIDQLGKPSAIDRSCTAYGTQLLATCDHVFVYRSSFAPLSSSYWLIFFDAAGSTKATSRQTLR